MKIFVYLGVRFVLGQNMLGIRIFNNLRCHGYNFPIFYLLIATVSIIPSTQTYSYRHILILPAAKFIVSEPHLSLRVDGRIVFERRIFEDLLLLNQSTASLAYNFSASIVLNFFRRKPKGSFRLGPLRRNDFI